MKIWIMTSETPRFNPGGIARYVDNFARYLAAEGHQVLLISRHDSDIYEEIVEGYSFCGFVSNYDRLKEIPHNELPVAEHPGYPYNILQYSTALSFQYAQVSEEMLQRWGRPDIIECQEYGGIAYYFLQRKFKEFGYFDEVPLVLNLHSPEFIIRRYNEEAVYKFPEYWNGRMEQYCMLAADSLICPSQYLATQVERVMSDYDLEVNVFPLPWTDVSHFDEETEVVPNSVVYLGRLEVRKGVLPMLKACEKLWRKGHTFSLTLIGGDTPYSPRSTNVGDFIKKKYEQWIEQGLLVLPGFMPQEVLLNRIRSAAVIVIPSVWENFPNTCMEAMSLGKVIVASEYGGMAEMMGRDEKAGFLHDWNDDESFSRQLLRALSLDADTAQAMGQEAKKRIAEICHPKTVVAKRIAHFKEVIANHKVRKEYPFLNLETRQAGLAERFPKLDSVEGMISVIIPFYNLGDYVDDALNSVLESNYPSVEILIINDGSTDEGSCRKLEEIKGRRIEQLRILNIENGGLANARNVGADAARGEFIAFLDADDAVTPSFFEKAVYVMRRYDNVHLVYSWVQYFEENQSIFPTWDLEFPYMLAHNMLVPICVVRRDAFLAFGRNKRKMAYNFEDYDGWISMAEAGCGGVSIPELLVRYRVRKNSMWQASDRNQHLYLYDLLVENHPELYRKYGGELFLLQNSNGPAEAWLHPSKFCPYEEVINKKEANIEHWRRKSFKFRDERDAIWHEKEIEHHEKMDGLKRIQALEAELNQLKASQL